MSTFSHITDKQLRRSLASLADLNQAAVAISLLQSEVDWNRMYKTAELRKFRCYETTAIVAFSRPFATGRSGVSLSLKALGVNLTEPQKALKKKVQTLRDKIVAHTDDDWMHYRISLHEFAGFHQPLPHYQADEGIRLSEAELREFDGMVNEILEGIRRLMFDMSRECPERVEVYVRPGVK
tara:strand:+ start:170 stop:712 length:543 start_codon:yes stop_codon:yes gene_type:complete